MNGKIFNGRPMFQRGRRPNAKTKSVPGTEWFWLPRRLLQTDDTISNAYAQNAWAHAAIKLKARMAASVPLNILTGNRRERDGEPVRGDDAVLRLLECPSPLMTGHEFIEATSIYLDLAGEAFWIGYGRNGEPFRRGEIPAEILIIQPAGMAPDIDERTGLVLGWKFAAPNGNEYAFTADQVGHPKEFDPANPYRGLAPITPVIGGMNYALRATSFNNSLLANGADPGGIIYSESPLTQDEATGLRNQWEDRHRGSLKAARLAILSGGLKYEPLAVTAKDMAFSDALGWGKSEILAVLGVTKFDLGEVEETNRASSLTAKANTWEKTILPRLRLMESTLWHWMFEPLSARLGRDIWPEFDVSEVEALQAPMTEKAQQAQILVAAGYDKSAVNERLGLKIEEYTADAEALAQIENAPESSNAATAPDATTLMAVVEKVGAGTIAPEAAVGVLLIAFPQLTEAAARALISAATPKQTEPPAPAAASVPEPIAKQTVAKPTAGVKVGERFYVDGKAFRVIRKANWNAKSRDDSKVERIFRTRMREIFRQIRTEEMDAVAKYQTVLEPALAANVERTNEDTATASTKATTEVTQRLQPQGIPFVWPPGVPGMGAFGAGSVGNTRARNPGRGCTGSRGGRDEFATGSIGRVRRC
jgi:HK97 family phage portal protein